MSHRSSKLLLLHFLLLTACGARTGPGDFDELGGWLASSGGSGGSPAGGGFNVGGGGGLAGGSGGIWGSGGSTAGGSGGSPCGPEQFDNPATPAIDCTPHTHCQPGYYVVTDAGPFWDRYCASCETIGYSTTVDSKSCLPWSDCALGEVETEAATALRDRSCAKNPEVSVVPLPDKADAIASQDKRIYTAATTYGSELYLDIYDEPFGLSQNQIILSTEPLLSTLALRLSSDGGRLYALGAFTATDATIPYAIAFDQNGGELWRNTASPRGPSYAVSGATITSSSLFSLGLAGDGLTDRFLIEWPPTPGAPQELALSGEVPSAQSISHIGSDAFDVVHLLNPLQLTIERRAPDGTWAPQVELPSELSRCYSCLFFAVSPTGGYVLGPANDGTSTLVHYDWQGVINWTIPLTGFVSPVRMLTVGENVIVVSMVSSNTATEILIEEWNPVGEQLRRVPVAHGNQRWIIDAAVAPNGRVDLLVRDRTYGEYYGQDFVLSTPAE